jgi:serine/threonine protein kinase
MDLADNKMEKLEFGEWKLERLLGSGAFGKVLLMVNRLTGLRIAVKKIHRDSPFVVDNNWDKELDILRNLKHPGKHHFQLSFFTVELMQHLQKNV